MPIVAARHAGAIGICVLMAGVASKSRYSLARWSTNDVRKMTMSIVALLWIAGSGVTVDATRMSKNRIHLLPGIEALLSVDARFS
jgi:hypothetical protein